MRTHVLIAVLTLTGCAQTPGKGNMALVGPMPSAGIVDVTTAYAAVAVVPEMPIGSTPLGEVTGASCKNSLLDPPATNEKALVQLREKAALMGATAVYGVRYEPDPLPVAKNCWQIINATGYAVK